MSDTIKDTAKTGLFGMKLGGMILPFLVGAIIGFLVCMILGKQGCSAPNPIQNIKTVIGTVSDSGLVKGDSATHADSVKFDSLKGK